MDNTVLTYNGMEVYQSEIDILCSEYISSLHDESMIYKSTVFSGMLNYIYRNKLKYIIPNTYNNDYALLDDIFNNIYIELCTRYNICPSIIQFSVLCNIDNGLMSSINKGVHDDGSRVNPITVQTVKKWYATCEAMLLGKAQNENAIGAIFALKANYKYRDNDIIQAVPLVSGNVQTPEEIAERYASHALPDKPILSDN